MYRNLGTKYYTADLLIRELPFESEDKIKAILKELKHKECIIFIVDSDSSSDYIKSCLSINEELDTDITILFYSKLGDKSKDEGKEDFINKLIYDSEAEKIIEQINDNINNEINYDCSKLSLEDEKTGMLRVLEALECNMWSNMIKVVPQNKKPMIIKEEEKKLKVEDTKKQLSDFQTKDKEITENKASQDPNINIENEMEDFEGLMHDLMVVKEK